MRGHKVHRPLTLLHDTIVYPEPPNNLIEYVNGFRYQLYAAGEMATEKLASSQEKMKHLYNRNTEQCQYCFVANY